VKDSLSSLSQLNLPECKQSEDDSDSENVRILCWNLNVANKQHLAELEALMSDADAQIALIQECRWHPVHNPPPTFTNYKVYYNHTNYKSLKNKKGGTAIIVRKDIESVVVEAPDKEKSSTTWARIFTKKGSFIVASCYFQEKDGESVTTLRDSLREFTGKVIIGGDFNAHHEVWDNSCKNPNKAGSTLHKQIEDFNLLVHNSPDIPTHDPKGEKQKSIIDLILSTVSMSAFVSCKVLEEDLPSSHHRPILATVKTSILRDEFTLRKATWRVHAADEQVFQEECEELFKSEVAELKNEKSPHKLAEKIGELVKTLLRKTVPRTKITRQKNGQKRQPWWNKTIQRLVRCCRKARRYAQRFPNSRAIKKRYVNLFRRRLEATKAAQAVFQDKKWREYSRKPQQFLWKTVKEAIGQQSTAYPPLNKGAVTDKKDKANLFLESYQEVSRRTALGKFDEKHKEEVETFLAAKKSDFSTEQIQVDYNSEIREEELRQALSKLKKSAVGPDGIPNWAYKHASPSMREALLVLFNLSFIKGEFPESFRYADIVSLPKAGKDHTLPKNYRPISLTNTLARIFESIIHKRLYAYCENSNVLPPSQFAYRHNNSSIDPLILLTQDIKKGFHYSSATEMIQLDITKAFDTVWLDGKLHKIGLRNHLLAWLASYIENRKYRVITPETTDFQEFQDGVPQGSCLSPLLFTIFLADIASELKCTHAEFADDLTLWRIIDKELEAEKDMQHDLKVIEGWSNKWRISFGEKCSHTLFYNHHSKRKYKPKLIFNGKQLQHEEKPKLLGLNLDPQLTYRRHIKILETKLRQKIGIFYTKDGYALPRKLLQFSLLQRLKDYYTT